MRNWKIGSWARVAAGRGRRPAASSCIARTARLSGGAGRRRADPRGVRHAGAGDARSSRRRSRSISTTRRAPNRSATSRCRPRFPGYILKQHVADGADVKEGDLLYTIDPRDFQAALDQAKAQVAARHRGARLCALQSRSRHRARQERLSRQGYASTSAPARCARPRRRSRWTRPRSAPPSSISAIPRSARPSPAGSAATRRPIGTLVSAGGTRAQHAGAARSDLRDLQSERDRSRRDPEGARRAARSRPRSCCPAKREAHASRAS